MKIARSFNCGFDGQKSTSPGGATEFSATVLSAAPAGLDSLGGFYPQLKLRAIFSCPFGTFPAARRSFAAYLAVRFVHLLAKYEIKDADKCPNTETATERNERQRCALMPIPRTPRTKYQRDNTKCHEAKRSHVKELKWFSICEWVCERVRIPRWLSPNIACPAARNANPRLNKKAEEKSEESEWHDKPRYRIVRMWKRQSAGGKESNDSQSKNKPFIWPSHRVYFVSWFYFDFAPE
jgi:hypothetical protein